VLGEATSVGFDSDVQDWGIIGDSETDLASSLAYSPDVGAHAPGSLQIEAAFSAREQQVEIGPLSGALNLQNSKMSLQVRRTGAFDGGVMVFFITADSWTAHGLTMLPSEDWVTIDVSLSALLDFDPTFDPAAVTQWGVMFNTGEAGSVTPGPVTFYVDDITLQSVD
jgi:hypothetical protein